MIIRSKAVCIISKPFKLIQFLSLTVFTENLNPFNVPSNLIEDPFKIAVRQFFLQCHDIQAISPGTAQYIYTLTHTYRLSFQQVVAICMDTFKTDGRTERRTNYIKALSAPIMHNYARAHSSRRFALPWVLLTRWPFCHSTLTWSEFEWTFLYVHGEIREIHGTAGFNCQSTGVEHASVLIDAHKLIRGGYRVQIALFAIVKIRIRLPDARQHRDGQRQCVLCALEGKTLIHPGLSKITVHRVGLQAKREKRA